MLQDIKIDTSRLASEVEQMEEPSMDKASSKAKDKALDSPQIEIRNKKMSTSMFTIDEEEENESHIFGRSFISGLSKRSGMLLHDVSLTSEKHLENDEKNSPVDMQEFKWTDVSRD